MSNLLQHGELVPLDQIAPMLLERIAATALAGSASAEWGSWRKAEVTRRSASELAATPMMQR